MTKISLMALLFLFVLFGGGVLTAQDTLPYQDPSAAIDARVADLLARMTLEEKSGRYWNMLKCPLHFGIAFVFLSFSKDNV